MLGHPAQAHHERRVEKAMLRHCEEFDSNDEAISVCCRTRRTEIVTSCFALLAMTVVLF